MIEKDFVSIALAAANQVLAPPLSIKEAKSLLYQITVDNRLELTVDPKRPSRGRSAFQTDLCVFETISEDTSIPRVVLEFKVSVSTHDILTYSSKAKKHKQVYPYLRYGLVTAKEKKIPRRFFLHNESLDFVVAAGSHREDRLVQLIADLLSTEVAASRQLESLIFGTREVYSFRYEIATEDGNRRIS